VVLLEMRVLLFLKHISHLEPLLPVSFSILFSELTLLCLLPLFMRFIFLRSFSSGSRKGIALLFPLGSAVRRCSSSRYLSKGSYQIGAFWNSFFVRSVERENLDFFRVPPPHVFPPIQFCSRKKGFPFFYFLF